MTSSTEENQNPKMPPGGPGLTKVRKPHNSKFLNPKYYIKSALCAVHILDGDWNEKTGDGAPEWGRILLAGKAYEWINMPVK